METEPMELRQSGAMRAGNPSTQEAKATVTGQFTSTLSYIARWRTTCADRNPGQGRGVLSIFPVLSGIFHTYSEPQNLAKTPAYAL